MKKLSLLLVAFFFLMGCRTTGPFDQFAMCVSEKGAKMYGSDTCPHCQEQKKSFKGSFDLVTYVQCDKDLKACEDAGITAYPTWEINGKKTQGRKSLSELAELTGCVLNAPATTEAEATIETPKES